MVSHGSDYRRYTSHSLGGKQELTTWIQRRCKLCGKFLSKFQRIYCSICGNKENQQKRNYAKNKDKRREASKNWRLNNPKKRKISQFNYFRSKNWKEYNRLRKKVLNHANEFKIGDYI